MIRSRRGRRGLEKETPGTCREQPQVLEETSVTESMVEALPSWLHSTFTLLGNNSVEALFVLLVIEEMGVPLPVPGDIVIMFVGYRASTGQGSLLWAAVTVVVAVQLGSTVLYTLSRKLGRTVLFRYGRLVHLKPERLMRVETWIRQRGPVMVLMGRLTPGLRTPTSIMAGVFRIQFRHFMFFATLAAAVWGTFWLLLGYFGGRTLIPIVRRLHPPLYVVVIVILVVAAVLLLYVWWREIGEHSREEGE